MKPKNFKQGKRDKPFISGRLTPDYNILYVGLGAVRFNYPKAWHIVRGDHGSVRLHDCLPPDDNADLSITYIRLPPDMPLPPLSHMIRRLYEIDTRKILSTKEPVSRRKADLDMAFGEELFFDSTGRDAVSLSCLARNRVIQASVMFDFWAEDRKLRMPIWEEVIESLELASPPPEPILYDMLSRN